VRGYNAFLAEEAAQVKKLTPYIAMSWVTVPTVTVTARDVIRTASDSNATILVTSTGQVMSVTDAHWDIQIQNLCFWVARAAAQFAPATFRFHVVVERPSFWILRPADLPDWAAPS